MGKVLYVGNLAHSVSSPDLQEWFGPFGPVHSAQVVQTVARVAARGSVLSRWTQTPKPN